VALAFRERPRDAREGRTRPQLQRRSPRLRARA
jgi:hypothetical protein